MRVYKGGYIFLNILKTSPLWDKGTGFRLYILQALCIFTEYVYSLTFQELNVFAVSLGELIYSLKSLESMRIPLTF